MDSYSREKKTFIQRPEQQNIQFGAVADIYRAKK